MILPSDIAWLIKELPSGPPAQVRDALIEVLEAMHSEICTLQKQVERLKLRDAPFKQFGVAGRYQGRDGSPAKRRNGVNSPTLESKGESVKSIRGQRDQSERPGKTRPVKAGRE